MKLLICSMFLLLLINCNAVTINEYINAQSDYYSSYGEVGERIAKLHMECETKSTVYHSVSYWAAEHYRDREYHPRTKGELDLVVVRDGKVTHVVEVKVWKNPLSGLKKAKSQLDRLKDSLKYSRIEFSDTNITQDMFGDEKYMTFSYKGTKELGYSEEFIYSYKDVKNIYSYVISNDHYNIEDGDYCYLVEDISNN